MSFRKLDSYHLLLRLRTAQLFRFMLFYCPGSSTCLSRLLAAAFRPDLIRHPKAPFTLRNKENVTY
jgi:hypothetical protein